MDKVELEKLAKLSDLKEYDPAGDALSFQKSICDSDGVTLKDGYYNNFTSVGEASTFGDGGYILENLTMNWMLWISLWGTSWVFKKAIDKPAEDMVANGIEVTSDMDSDDKKMVEKALSKLRPQVFYALQTGRLFGGGISVILVDGVSEDDLLKPASEVLKKVKKGSAIRLVTIDRWYGLGWDTQKVVEDRADPDYGKPEYYTISLGDDQAPIRVHHSWCIRLVGRKPPKFLEQLLQGWDLAEGTYLYTYLLRSEKTKASIASLIDKSLLEVVKMNGMKGLFTGMNPDQKSVIEDRVTMLTAYRNFNNFIFMDNEDEYEQFQASVTGLAEILDKDMDEVAGATGIPRVIFYGETKGGLGSDTPAEWIGYAKDIASKQEVVLRPFYDKLLPFILVACGIELKDGEVIDYVFNPVYEITDETRLERAEKFVGIMSSLLDMGVYTPQLVAKELSKKVKDFGFGSVLDDAYINQLANETSLEMEENFDNDEEEEQTKTKDSWWKFK